MTFYNVLIQPPMDTNCAETRGEVNPANIAESEQERTSLACTIIDAVLDIGGESLLRIPGPYLFFYRR